MKHVLFCFYYLRGFKLTAQEVTDSMLLNKAKDKAKEKLNISGTMGITYEGYGLNRNPSGWTGYLPRRPWEMCTF